MGVSGMSLYYNICTRVSTELNTVIMSQVKRRTNQIKRYYLDRKMAERHCEDIEAYLEQQLRSYLKHAAYEILRGSIMTHRQRVDFVRGWMRSWLSDDTLYKRVVKPKSRDREW